MAASGAGAASIEQNSTYWRALARRQRRRGRRLFKFSEKGFHDLGYIEGKNIHLDQRFPAENPERFRKLGQELVDNQRLRGANYWSTLGQVQGDQVASQGGLGD